MALQEEFEVQGNWLFKRRSYMPMAALLAGYGLFLKKEIYPETSFFGGTPYEIYYEMFCLVVSLLGLLVRVYTVGHTPRHTSGRNTKEGQVADTLNTTGIYSVVRHPLYLGNFLMWLGLAMLTGNLWFTVAFGLFYWVYYERIMYAEEQFLRRKFGEQYTRWAAEVPAFFPLVKCFRKPCLPFNWKKVIKKEKNGTFALFLLFTIFDISEEFLQKDQSYNYFLIGLTGLTGIGYVVIKILRKKTKLLRED
ncbi:MAG: methyltransferase family protein [Bernardetiaceae bacterium]